MNTTGGYPELFSVEVKALLRKLYRTEYQTKKIETQKHPVRA
jgi:hypothetical protein